MLSEIIQSVQIAITEASVMTGWEAVAVILAMAYLLLAMKTNIWCWAAAFASTAIYTVLFWKVSLLMESVLNVYYMAMAIYGFWLWRSTHQTNSTDSAGNELVITSWSLKTHLLLIGFTTVVSLIVGYFMATKTTASFPYIDALTTCFAIMTTYLVAKKVLENWLYWVVIDFVSIYLYFQKGLMLTSGLFILYVFMALSGYFMWRKKMQQTSSYHDLAVAS
ncbi:nicotinamide riboside transporter PnuC [Shewanella donghaensis]|uniref:nicotinamide riboside transporter PnuC n=1 Tax=Shewanella donghaensis TaxID=238836 RepID=UPI001181EF84|nr:nicotinamide riboside transporter PnuC [Shewanella donghaensis]